MQNQSQEPTALNCSVLVLNRAYLPVHVVSARRAIVMLYRDLAEVIYVEDGNYNNFDFQTWLDVSGFLSEEKKAHDDWVQGIGFEFLVPRVIRLFNFDKVPKQTLRFNRRNLFARDENTCQYCVRKLPHNQLSFDHVMPRSRGGETSWMNVVCCCIRCNTTKGNRTPKEANMELIQRPSKPRFSPVLTMKMEHPKYQVWKAFVQASKTPMDGEHREFIHYDV